MRTPINSVDSPRRDNSPFEGMESGQTPLKREVVRGAPGEAGPSPAANHFLVRGTKDEPLRPPAVNVFESLLADVDRREQILETDLAPWRMICSLQIIGAGGLSIIATGWFAGPRTLVTAGHCVFDPLELGGWATQITVVPGRNGDRVQPFGTAISTEFSTTDRWLQAQDPDFDYAAIHLSTDLGSTTGVFGVGVLTDEELKDRLVNVSGYPVAPGDGKLQYFHANRVNAITARRVFYDVDTVNGESGAPVWTYLDDAPDSPVVVGIHAYGIGGVPAGLNVKANSGPRILPEVLDVIRVWINRGTP